MPKISFIIPVFNAEKYLKDCIDSVMHLNSEDFEILLINDGSTDNSGQICDEYGKEYKRIRVFHKVNGGVSSARNLGLENAKGEYVNFLDSDDYVNSGIFFNLLNIAVEKNLELLMSNQAIHVDVNKNFLRDDKNSYLSKSILRAEHKIFNGKEFLSLSTFNDGIVTSIFNRKFLIKNEIYFSETNYLEDLTFLLNAILKAEKMISHPSSFYYVRHSNNSATRHNDLRKHKTSFENILGVLINLKLKNKEMLNNKSKKLLDQKIQNFTITLMGVFQKIENNREKAKEFLALLKNNGLYPLKFNFYKGLPLKSKVAYYVTYHRIVYLRKFK